jgi:SAM-dependent methyltransferase
MTFRELVIFWEQLQRVSSVETHGSVLQDLIKIMFVAQRSSGAINTERLQLKHQEILTGFVDFEQILNELKEQIKTRVEDEEKEWFQRSSHWYKSELDMRMSQHPDFPKQLRNRRVELDLATESLYVARIMQHNNWHYPGMIIHPGEEPFMQYMVGNDPLYLVDESHDLLDLVDMSNYDEVYQRRLRNYVIDESSEHEILEKIPDAQFGICLAYHYFDFKPYEIIEKYLVEIYQKLRPGGTLIMTFNDCERPAALTLVENNYASYNRATMIKNLAEKLNYSIKFFHWEQDSPSSWLELRKPGTLTSLRGGQTLAEIMPKPVANSK